MTIINFIMLTFNQSDEFEDIELTKRKSTVDQAETTEHAPTEFILTTEAVTTHNASATESTTTSIGSTDAASNQLQSDAEFFTKRFSNEATTNESNKRVRRVNN
ncbi:hypothetical protein ACTFIW_006069 [Dictyostelium discoideum]